MKKLFKKTWFAVLLCVIAVVATTLLNTRSKFGPLCGAMREQLYGTDSKGVSLLEQLQVYCGSFDTLLSLASGQRLDTAAAEQANEALRAAAMKTDVPARELYGLYAMLVREEERLSAQLGEMALGTHDAATLQRCLGSLETAKSTIGSFQYNARLAEFLDDYDRFPTNALAAAVGLSYPESFSD